MKEILLTAASAAVVAFALAQQPDGVDNASRQETVLNECTQASRGNADHAPAGATPPRPSWPAASTSLQTAAPAQSPPSERATKQESNLDHGS